MARKIEKYNIKRYESIAQFERTIMAAKSPWPKDERIAEIATERAAKWYGTATMAEANDLLLHGDKSAAKQEIFKSIAAIRQQIQKDTKRRTLYSDVCGCAPNVPAYIAGCPKSMINTRQTSGKQKVITVVYNGAISARSAANEVAKNAANLLGAILALEAGGARINLYAAIVASKWDNTRGTIWNGFFLKVKTAAQYVDVAKLVYPLTHASFTRRHFFKFQEAFMLPKKYREDGGYPADNIPADIFKLAGIKPDRVLSYYGIEGKGYKEIANMIDLGA